jgi:hypothetical protein
MIVDSGVLDLHPIGSKLCELQSKGLVKIDHQQRPRRWNSGNVIAAVR